MTALDLDPIAAHWQIALDSTQRALEDSTRPPLQLDLGQEQRRLDEERRLTGELLERLAQVEGVAAPWLSPVPVSRVMLGLPDHIEACLFDLDGVLTDSGMLHARAWAEVFDAYLLRLAEQTGWYFIPFDADLEYGAFLDGRPRFEGVRVFLTSRGLSPSADDVRMLAAHKAEVLERGLHERGVNALAGARRYLAAVGHAGLARVVVSASASTRPMLELAELGSLVDDHVDADVIRSGGLRSRPAPDLLLAACARVGVEPARAVTLTHTPAGIVAGRAAGLCVIGVAGGSSGELLRDYGAERVVDSLGRLLAPRLAAIA